MTRQQAEAIRAAMTKAGEYLTDEQASEVTELYAPWKPNKDYVAGQRLSRNGKLFTVLQDHKSQDDWTPEDAPSLFAEVLPGQSGTEIGEWKQPDSTNPYMKDDAVLYQDRVWISDVDNNVWEPGVYGWHLDA